MDCRQCAENLTAFLDRELSSTEAEHVQDHVRGCAHCADELRSLQESAGFIQMHALELKLRPDSWHMVRARISTMDSLPAHRRFMPFGWRIATAALALVVFSSVGYIKYQQIERKSLDQYISRYIQERAEHRQLQSVLASHNSSGRNQMLYADNPFVEIQAAGVDNPFIEVNKTLADNPFRSEER